jgi:hypothetical protein
MPTPEQQREYTRLSSRLQQLCLLYYHEIPEGTTSVLLTITDRKARLAAYKSNGDLIAVFPNASTSIGFREALTRIANVSSLDADGITAIL